ncbi:ScbR family autoregulator-binding transcription factor [Kitasatospora sp. NPDC001175]|uniref:ScbR family autoregulator-binding transcription factor n=1 Tax=Kitasatospora sp. NPDC001175 TaxID=3157103 RepID=UPI003D062649
MPRQERAERTRQLLIEAAASSFDADGYTMTGLGDVTRLSGMSKGALYFHFGSKEQLAEAVLAGSRDGLRECVRQARASGGPTIQYLIHLCHSVARRIDDDVVFRAGLRLTGDPGLDRSVCPSPQASWVRMVRLLLRRAAWRREIHTGAPMEVAADLLGAAAVGVELLARQETRWLDREMLTRMWWAVLPALVLPEHLDRLNASGSVPDGLFPSRFGAYEPGAPEPHRQSTEKALDSSAAQGE